MATDERISLSEASRRAGVSAGTLKRWAEEKVVPVRRGRWTAAAAAQARVVARMRERGHSLEDLKRAGREGRLAFGFTEDLFPKPEEQTSVEEVARESGLATATHLGQVPVALCFIDLTGFTRYTQQEGDLEALDVVENFVETVEATIPPEATIVKTIGDEVLVVSPDAASLTEWAVDLL